MESTLSRSCSQYEYISFVRTVSLYAESSFSFSFRRLDDWHFDDRRAVIRSTTWKSVAPSSSLSFVKRK